MTPSKLDPASPPTGRGAWVHYSPKGILVCADHQDVERFGANGFPAELLPLDPTPERLGESVLRSMRGSRKGLSKEEARSESAGVLKLSGERNWGRFEKHWEAISVFFEPGEQTVTILPMRRYGGGGYIPMSDDATYDCPASAQALGEVLLKIIRAGPPPVMPYEPSHT